MASGASKEVKITVKSTVGNTFANVATVSADNDAYSGDNSDAANAYVYVPTCGAYTADGKRFPCPVGTVFDSSEVRGRCRQHVVLLAAPTATAGTD